MEIALYYENYLSFIEHFVKLLPATINKAAVKTVHDSDVFSMADISRTDRSGKLFADDATNSLLVPLIAYPQN